MGGGFDAGRSDEGPVLHRRFTRPDDLLDFGNDGRFLGTANGHDHRWRADLSRGDAVQGPGDGEDERQRAAAAGLRRPARSSRTCRARRLTRSTRRTTAEAAAVARPRPRGQRTVTSTSRCIVPNTMFEGRIRRLDLRLTQDISSCAAGFACRSNLDAYNALNSSAIQTINNTLRRKLADAQHRFSIRVSSSSAPS